MRRRGAVASLGQRLAVDRGQVHGEIGPILDRFGMAPGEVRVVALMARIGGGHRISGPEQAAHGGEGHGRAVAAVADHLELAVPAGGRQPQLEADV